jgi:hypothetical protein
VLGGLNRDVSQEKLDLIQFAACDVTQSRTGSPEVVWCQLFNTSCFGCLFEDPPKNFGRHPVSPDSAGFVD